MLAFSLILLFIPLFILIAIGVRWKIGHSILFKQVRTGLYGKRFVLYKFCSMTHEKDANGQLLPDIERLPEAGKWLRKSSLDELPQLWNILKGEMAFVGPRPLLPEYNSKYSAHQSKRLSVLPGITGWAQINGRNAISWAEKFELDVWYIYHKSFALDLKILLLTVIKIFKTEVVNADNDAPMQVFKGNE